MAVSPGDVGRRVVVRRVLPTGGDDAGADTGTPGARPRFADVLGELVAADATHLVVRRADGTIVTVDVADVVAAKQVPPASRRRPSVAGLERIAALGWQGVEQEWLGGWLLRAGHGFTGRANSVLPLEPPDADADADLDAALATVVDWYDARGLPATFAVPLPLAGELDAQLAGRGWRAVNPTSVLTGDLAALRERAGVRADLPPVVHEATPTQRWLGGYEYRGRSLPPGARDVLARAAAPTFASVRAGDAQLAVARGVVDERWLGITAVTVRADARRRGIGAHLMRGLADWAIDRGADRAYLQAADDNGPAHAMYRGLGFTRHHGYHYRVRDRPTPATDRA